MFAYNNEATILFDANTLRVQSASKVRFCIRIVQSRSSAHMFAYAKGTPVILSRWIIHYCARNAREERERREGEKEREINKYIIYQFFMLSRDISKARRVVFPGLSPGIPYLTDEDLCLPWRTVPGELFGLVSIANSSVVLPKMFSRPPDICASVLLTLALRTIAVSFLTPKPALCLASRS